LDFLSAPFCRPQPCSWSARHTLKRISTFKKV
jgi:hypothetical protein